MIKQIYHYHQIIAASKYIKNPSNYIMRRYYLQILNRTQGSYLSVLKACVKLERTFLDAKFEGHIDNETPWVKEGRDKGTIGHTQCIVDQTFYGTKGQALKVIGEENHYCGKKFEGYSIGYNIKVNGDSTHCS